MENLPDDPIIDCLLRTGLPPWLPGRGEDKEE